MQSLQHAAAFVVAQVKSAEALFIQVILVSCDIKMVLRLALRIADKRGEHPSQAIFARCILFRGLTP